MELTEVLNKRNMVLCLLVLIAMGSFFVAPYLTMVGFSGIMAFYIIASDREKITWHTFFLYCDDIDNLHCYLHKDA